MDTILLALLFGAALWMMDLYNASKFRFFYPKLKADLLPSGTARWKRVWVFGNQTLKHMGLVATWAGFTLGKSFSDAYQGPTFHLVGLFGLVLYVASRLWPLIVDERPRH